MSPEKLMRQRAAQQRAATRRDAHHEADFEKLEQSPHARRARLVGLPKREVEMIALDDIKGDRYYSNNNFSGS